MKQLSALSLILFTIPAFAQVSELSIGDKLPGIKIKNVMNAPGDAINLASLKGKAIIIDFWEKDCLACVDALPKLKKLQDEYRDQLAVITVTSLNAKKEIRDRLAWSKATKDIDLPIVIKDDQLRRYFPFKIVSHVVWVGKDGLVKAITGTESVNKEQIASLVDGKELDLPLKRDLSEFEDSRPLASISFTGVQKPAYLSAFTGPVNGLGFLKIRVIKDSTSGTMTVNHLNVPLIELCKASVKGRFTGDFDLKDVILEVPNREKYNWEKREKKFNWSAAGTNDNTYCYSVTLPVYTTRSETTKIITRDLSHWLDIALGIKVTKEKRWVDCGVLKRTTADTLFKSSGGEPVEKTAGGEIQFSNVPLYSFIAHLGNNVFDIPVINETGLPDECLININFTISSLSNPEELKTALKAWGLELVKEKREKEMYVITEKTIH